MYIYSNTEPNSVSVNAHRWPQDEDSPDPAFHCRIYTSAPCR